MQNQSYPLLFDFRPHALPLRGLRQFLALEFNGAPITVSRPRSRPYQQDLYFDDLALLGLRPRDPFVRLTRRRRRVPVQRDAARDCVGFRFQPGWRVGFALDASTPDEQLWSTP